MKTKALAPWFGSSRIIAPHVGALLRGCRWVGVPFAGGMCELAEIDARTIAVSDLHRHVINLARVVADDTLFPALVNRLGDKVFHQDELRDAQLVCAGSDPISVPDLWAAENYFVACWMGRNGNAGIDDEFNSRLSIRWNANGGDSALRYRNAVASLEAWHTIMRRCTFDVLDCFEFLERCEDTNGHGIYCDPPWPDDGEKYRHKFTTTMHERLATKLAAFHRTRIVVRFGVHPLIERLYPRERWQWNEIAGRTQANNAKREVLLVRNAACETLFE